MQRVGVIGLGLVGSAIARRLLAAGFAVEGYDLRVEAREALVAMGGAARGGLRELGETCGVVVLALFESRDVVEVVEGRGGLLEAGVPLSLYPRPTKPEHLPPGSRLHTIIDCSTGTPDVLASLAQRLHARGIDFIEAPLSGSSRQIEDGVATQLVAGDPAAIDRCAPVLDAITAHRVQCGAPGMAAKAKLATNLVLGLNRAALAEGFAFAETLGIAPETFLELVLATPARSAAAEAKGAMMVSGDFTPQSRIRQHLKDVDLMLESAHASGQPLPLSQAHAGIMRRAIEAGDGDLDNAAILRQWRRDRRSTG